MNDVVLDLKLRSSKAERFNKPRRRKANLFGRARPCGVETGKVVSLFDSAQSDNDAQADNIIKNYFLNSQFNYFTVITSKLTLKQLHCITWQ
jgi:hypothetical protein